ncbi:unnamed protein product [Rangifer tarandus platyrhynchus]|uniref:Uncharacterized protein n=1 Tax=Rangifer tarandus platyrhynchus TaxID=3082113 RepID=A0ABN8ZWP3_RANTA|nr:unnamed protein product [Rangifer tarandus platyrhynchus]
MHGLGGLPRRPQPGCPSCTAFLVWRWRGGHVKGIFSKPSVSSFGQVLVRSELHAPLDSHCLTASEIGYLLQLAFLYTCHSQIPGSSYSLKKPPQTGFQADHLG